GMRRGRRRCGRSVLRRRRRGGRRGPRVRRLGRRRGPRRRRRARLFGVSRRRVGDQARAVATAEDLLVVEVSLTGRTVFHLFLHGGRDRRARTRAVHACRAAAERRRRTGSRIGLKWTRLSAKRQRKPYTVIRQASQSNATGRGTPSC